VHLPPALPLAVLRVASWAVREVILSGEELRGLMSECLVSQEPPRGTKSVLAWLQENGRELGGAYESELDRHGRGRSRSAPPGSEAGRATQSARFQDAGGECFLFSTARRSERSTTSEHLLQLSSMDDVE
jgi:hypothetical protein